MKPQTTTIENEIQRFYFKVNNSKLEDENKLQNQIKKVIQRLILKNKIESKSIELFFGTVEDDFIYNRCRVRISFN